jgi:hypothetical protein
MRLCRTKTIRRDECIFPINSLLSAEKARRELGWEPEAKTTITNAVENGSYRIYKEQK